jgi:hypothetical protein
MTRLDCESTKEEQPMSGKKAKSPGLDWSVLGFPPALVEAAREGVMRVRARQKWERESAVPLVPADHLYFRVEPVDPGATSSQTAEVKETFRRVFSGVWGRIPRTDRDALLRYLRTGAGAPLPLHINPTIRVVEGTPWAPAPPRCANLGRELSFDLAEVLEMPDDLPAVIATALAQVTLLADRRHWELIDEFIEAPMRRWERRHGKEVGDPEHEAKLDELEQAHHRAYEKELGGIVRGWGLEPAALPPWHKPDESEE